MNCFKVTESFMILILISQTGILISQTTPHVGFHISAVSASVTIIYSLLSDAASADRAVWNEQEG